MFIRRIFNGIFFKKSIINSAAFGGIVGLCSGFSLLSGVELIYWFSLRLLMDHLRHNKIRKGL